MRIRSITSAVALGTLLMSPVWAQQGDSQGASQGSAEPTIEQRARDAWIGGKLEAVFALNRHLNPFSIDTRVDNGMVTLEGTVQSDIDRDLAEELAKGIEGVTRVENQLQIDVRKTNSTSSASASNHEERTFGQWVDDTTTTAAIKTKLGANSNVKASSINVDTRYDVVTLRGEVESSEQKALAEQLARNTGDVEDVRNELTVHSDS